jgi:hypothetical protein
MTYGRETRDTKKPVRERVKALVESKPSRLQEVLKNGGNATKH